MSYKDPLKNKLRNVSISFKTIIKRETKAAFLAFYKNDTIYVTHWL